jgi:hypothetical protein
VFSFEDLLEPALKQVPYLFVNKMMPEYDIWGHQMLASMEKFEPFGTELGSKAVHKLASSDL